MVNAYSERIQKEDIAACLKNYHEMFFWNIWGNQREKRFVIASIPIENRTNISRIQVNNFTSKLSCLISFCLFESKEICLFNTVVKKQFKQFNFYNIVPCTGTYTRILIILLRVLRVLRVPVYLISTFLPGRNSELISNVTQLMLTSEWNFCSNNKSCRKYEAVMMRNLIIWAYCKGNRHFQCFIQIKVLLIQLKHIWFLVYVLKFE